MNRCLFMTLFSLFCAKLCFAQDLNFTFHHIDEQNGLGQSEEYHLFTDSKGYAWIGSENGLYRFDGQELDQYKHHLGDTTSLVENKISSQCFEDDEGNLWFTSFGALNCYHRKLNSFTSYSVNNHLKDYHAFYFDGTHVWMRIGIGEEGNLYLYHIESGQFEKKVALPGEKCLVIKKDGEVVHLLSTGLPDTPGLLSINLKKSVAKQIYFNYTSEGRKINFSNPTKGSMIDREGNVWVGLYNSIAKYEIGKDSGVVYEMRNANIPKDIGWVYSLLDYDKQHFLLGTSKGLFVFDKFKEHFSQYMKPNPADEFSIKTKGLNNIYLDDLDNLWLSGSSQKIAFSNIHKLRFSRLVEPIETSVVSLDEDLDGNIWCSTQDSGTYIFSPHREILYHTSRLVNPKHKNGYNPLPPIYFFLNSGNERWGNIGNYFFLWNQNVEAFKIKFSYFLGVANTDFDRINYCYSRSIGENLIARGNKIFRIKLNEDKVDTVSWFRLESFDVEVINFLFEDQYGNLFIGDDHNKLLIVSIEKDQFKLLTKIENFGSVNAAQLDILRNRVWIAGNKGISYFELPSMNHKKCPINEDVFGEKLIYDIVLDNNGMLWLPSNKGLIHLDPDKGMVHHYNTADGLRSSVFNKNASLISSKTGEIWVAGKKGINVFTPDEVHLLQNKPTPQISKILINDEEFNFDQNVTELNELVLDYSQNTLSFQFSALDYANPTSNQFFFQMEGYDKERVANQNRRFTRYGNIPPGNYKFKLWTTNSDLIINEEALELKISIIPPVYQRWWFYLLCTGFAVLLIYALFKYRLEQVLKVERLRTKIASDLHDDVGGILSGIAMQSELLELNANEKERGKLRQLAEMSRNAMSGLRDTVWAIDSRLSKFENLLDRMQEHAEETLIPAEIQFLIEVSNIEQTKILSGVIRQNLYLIYKEAITNISKHSNGNQAKILLNNSKSHFLMKIFDNGKVKEKNYKTTGMGLSNMHFRAEKLKAELTIKTDNGFEVILIMPHIK